MDLSFQTALDAFFERWFGFYPTAASRAGFHEYDPRLGPRDAASIADYLADLDRLEERIAGFDPGALTADERLDRELVLREIHGDRFWLDEVGRWRTSPDFYAAQMDFTLLLLLDYAPIEERMASITSRLEGFPDLVAAARANVSDPPRSHVEAALVAYHGLPDFLEGDLTDALEGVGGADLQARFHAAREAAVTALRGYATHLESEVLPDAHGDFALGTERFRKMNALLSGVDLPVDEMRRLGEAELERLLAVAEPLAAAIAPDAPPGDRLTAAFEALGEDRPEPGSIVSTAARFLERLESFAGSIGTVHPGNVEVREIPPFARTNFAYIWIPGAYERGADTGFYFIHPVLDEWPEDVAREFLATNNRWSILNTSGHEAYPGHYHHFGHVHRAPTRAQRLLAAYVTAEGWAHYAEEMAWEEGLFDSDPRLGLAVVQDALLRVVRFLVSIGLHTGGMTVEEARGMFHDRAHQDPVNARLQALRGTYDPEYLNYTLGKLMLRRLREDARAAAEARSEAFDLAAFHDEFMARGAPPIPWIARRMLGVEEWSPLGDGSG